MKNLLACWMSALIFSTIAVADTTWVAEGNISGIWNAQGSPYIVQGNLTLPTGSFLFIEPGVKVYFENSYSIHADSGAIFQAIGTETDSIFFTTDTLLNPNRWAGIEIYKAADTVRVEYCVFEYCGLNALGCSGSELVLTNSTLRHNLGSALATYHTNIETQDCIFEYNQGINGAAANLRFATKVIADNCIFRNNLGAHEGGAVFCNLPDELVIRDCNFVDNQCTAEPLAGGGGAIWFAADSVLFEGCEFIGNSSERAGGAILCRGSQGFQARKCFFQENLAGTNGGAIYYIQGELDRSPLITRCVFATNTANEGGAVFISDNDIGGLRNCTFIANTSESRGSALSIAGNDPHVINCVFAYSAGGEEAVRVQYDELNFIMNNLFFENEGWNCTPHLENEMFFLNRNRDSCDYFQNLYQDPQFENLAEGNYTPAQGSPLIDAGLENEFWGIPLDPDSTLPDIGAIYRHRAPDVTGIPDETSDAPEPNPLNFEFTLKQNYPNPFNAETSISYQLPNTGAVELAVYDITGRLAARLVNETQSAGQHNVKISSRNLSSGVYIYRLTAGEFQQSRKLMILK